MSPGSRRSAGERIGPFEIERYLASGGMGDVYVGRVVDTGEPIALKFLGDTSAASLQRFEREGRIASSLAHPHIVAGRGYGRADDGTAYIAMELLVGEDLEARMHQSGVSPAEAVAVATQVCDALATAHARRIVHRDLKPQNIFMCAGDSLNVKVLDFGIARLVDDRRMTGTGMLVGTWSYMSPEQARAEPDIDARSDLWSLGVVLYECLAGRLPFDAPTGAGTLYQVLFDSPPHLSKLVPHLPRPLVDLIHKLLSKTRDERPTSAAALGAALAALDASSLGDRRVAAPPAAAVTGDGETMQGSGFDVTMMVDAAGGTIENRLTSVVFLRGVSEPALVQDIARELQGRMVSLLGAGSLVVFGTDRWAGDEPGRAVRLALAVAASTEGVGIATGRAVRGTLHVVGAAVDNAVALARAEGISIDRTTAAIVRGRFSLSTRPDGTATLDPRAQRARATAPDSPVTTPFVGRDIEMSILLQAAETASVAQISSGVLVLGSAGMGKSRLRSEAMADLLRREPETTFMVGRCEAFRRDTPFAALIDALTDVVDASVVRVFSAAVEGGGDPVAVLDRARTTLESILRGVAVRGPIVLAIDDVQWLDASTQAAIRWVCENATDLPLAVWLFGRPEARDAVAGVVPGATVVELKPLIKSAAEKLLLAVAGVAADIVLERAGGHPLFLEELGRMFALSGPESLTSGSALPPSIEGAHLAQIDQLDPGDREFLKRSSVFGRTAWLDAVVSLGAESGGMDSLRKANLIVPRPRSRFEGIKEFAFRSGVMQEVTYGLWTDGQRARLHERAAQWLSEQKGVGPDELARHWEIAGDFPRAAQAYTAAAEASAYVSDTATTCAHAERALALSGDPAVRWRALVARDNALQVAGDRAVQASGLDEMERLASGEGAEKQAEAAWRRCYFARLTGDHDGALAAGLKTIELAADTADLKSASAAHNELALLHADDGSFDEATSHAVSARKLANKTGDEWLIARAIGTQAYVTGQTGNLVDTLELMELAAARYSRAGDRRREAVRLANAGSILMDMGRLSEASTRIEGAIEASRRVGNARTVAAATHNLGTIKRIVGDLAAARAHQEFVGAEAERLHYPRLTTSVAIELVYLALVGGSDGAEVLRLVEAAEHSAEQSRSPNLVAEAAAAGLRARLRMGADTVARVAVARALIPAVQRLDYNFADLSSAVYEAGGRTAEDLAVARDALARVTSSLDSLDDRRAYRDVFCRRYLTPIEVAAD